MKVLNLVDIDKSDIKYQIQKFPDGQNNLVINPYSVAEIKTITETNELSIQIKSRLNNWLDLELIICAVASLRNLKVKKIHLYVPYILGARSDRKFEIGGNRYIKDVIAPVLNSLNFESVTCIDPHSYVLENCINNFESINNKSLVEFALFNLYSSSKPKDNIILVSPDAGASHKIYKLAEQIGYKGDIITCSKERDIDGKITKTVVPISSEKYVSDKLYNKDFIIIDDLIDGGTTFIEIAKVLKNTSFFKGKIYLIVTHSIFSKGTDELLKYFDEIYTTNSYKEHNIEKVKVLNIF